MNVPSTSNQDVFSITGPLEDFQIDADYFSHETIFTDLPEPRPSRDESEFFKNFKNPNLGQVRDFLNPRKYPAAGCFKLTPQQVQYHFEKFNESRYVLFTDLYSKSSVVLLFGCFTNPAAHIREVFMFKGRQDQSALFAYPNADYALEIQPKKETAVMAQKKKATATMIAKGELNQRWNHELVRKMSTVEKKWLSKHLGMKRLEHEDLNVVHFQSKYEYKEAAKEIDHVRTIFNVYMVDREMVYEEALMYITYDFPAYYPSEMLVGFYSKWCAVSAIERFRKMSVEVRGEWNYNNQANHLIRVSRFPAGVQSQSDAEDFIVGVCRRRDIQIESIRVGEWKLTRPETLPSHGELKHCIESCLHQSSRNRITFREVVRDNGSTEINLNNAPWKVIRLRDENSKKVKFIVKFNTVADGVELMESIFENSSMLRMQGVDPILHPVYRCRTSISRRMRDVFEQNFGQLNASFAEGEVFSRMHRSRIAEWWKDDEGEGFIGVEGWNPEKVKQDFNKLKDALKPIEVTFEANDLFYGIGEEYAHSLMKKYKGEVLIDVDKYRKIISVFGSKAQEAQGDLLNFTSRKSSIMVDKVIYFESAKNVLFALQHMKLKSTEESCTIGKDHVRFQGTVQDYCTFLKALEKASAKAHDSILRLFNYASDVENITCAVCFSRPDDHMITLDCCHIICQECATHQVESVTSDCKFKIDCVHGCGSWSPDQLMNFIIGGPSRFEELDSLKLRKFLNRARASVISTSTLYGSCPRNDCFSIHKMEPAGVVKACSMCKLQYCTQCLAPAHGGRTCAEAFGLDGINSTFMPYIKEAARQCPGTYNGNKCPMVYVKGGGCNHMICSLCKCHFCHLCTDFACDNSQDLYAHLRQAHPSDPVLIDDSDDDDSDDDFM